MSRSIKFITGLSNPTYNNRFARTVGDVDESGRVGVHVFGTNGVPVRVKVEKLKTKAQAVPFDATVLEDDYFQSGFYLPSVASDNEPPNEEGSPTPGRYITDALVKAMPLAEVFLFNHERIFDAIYAFTFDRKMEMLVQQRILNGYFGNTDDGDNTLVAGTPALVFAMAGALAEQFVCKALRLLYLVGPRDQVGDGWFVSYYCEDRTTNVQIRMNFDDKPASLALIEYENECYMSLYVKD